jgi:pimeloyl-ACP methyl ester carboxylesterase
MDVRPGSAMSTFLLLHGASSTGWLWHRVAPILHRAGHVTVAPDLPCEDPNAGLEEYVAAACDAVADRPAEPVIVVAQSMAGLIAPVIATRRPVNMIVLLAAMIPRPGERGFDWWAATGQPQAQIERLRQLGLADRDPMDPEVVFVHDFPDELKAASLAHVRDQQAGPMATPSPISGWPDVPTKVIAAADDRLFPLAFMQAQARDRLGIEPDVVAGGHLAALSQPDAVTGRLLSYAAEATTVTQ